MPTYLPTAAVGTDSGPAIWANVNNSLTCNTTYATVDNYNTTPILTLSSFGVSDPAASVSNFGISVTGYALNDVGPGDGNSASVQAKLIVDGVTYTPNNSSAGFPGSFSSPTPGTMTFGGAAATWTPTPNWSAANLSTAQVQLTLSADPGAGSTTSCFIDCVQLITYLVGGGGVRQAAGMMANMGTLMGR